MSATLWKYILRGALVPILALALTACGDIYSREDFTKAVVGKSDDEVSKQFGKPGIVDTSNPKRVVWTYIRETFDLANQNKRDPKTMVIFEQQPDGKLVVTKVEFG